MLSKTTNKSRILVSLILFITSFGILISNFSTAKAQTGQTFVIQPADTNSVIGKSGYFIMTGNRGQNIQDAVKVRNTGTNVLQLLVYPVDGLTTQASGESYAGLEQPRKDVASWITLGKNEIEIAPGKEAIIPFSIIVPEEARAGQHLGGIAVQPKNNDNATKQSGNFGVSILPRGVTPIKFNVGGNSDVLSLKIGGVSFTNIDNNPGLTLNLLNDGTGFIKPKGEVTLTDSTGNQVFNKKLNLDNILPQDSIAYPVSGTLPAAGSYKVHASLDFGGSAPAIYDGTVEVKAPAVQTAAASATKSANAPAATAPATQAQPSNQATQTNPTQAQAAVDNGQAAVTPGNNSSVKLPFVNTTTSSGNSPVVTPASDSNLMLVGILIGVAAMLGLSTLGLGGYVLRSRSKKGKQKQPLG